MTEDEARHQMIVNLDVALHGDSVARNMAPYEVWSMLLNEVMALREEQERRIPFEVLTAKLRAALERDLRFRVETLPERGIVIPHDDASTQYELIYRSDVLSLIDERTQ